MVRLDLTDWEAQELLALIYNRGKGIFTKSEEDLLERLGRMLRGKVNGYEDIT